MSYYNVQTGVDTTGKPLYTSGAGDAPAPYVAPASSATPASAGITTPSSFDPNAYNPTTSPDATALSAATAARTAAYSDMGAPTVDDRTAATQQFQAQIDALNQVYAQQKQAEMQAGQGRLGQTSSIEAASGMLGSLSGKAMDDTQNTANTTAQTAIGSKPSSDIAGVYASINKAATDAATNRRDANRLGADASVAEIQGRQAQASKDATSATSAYFAAGNDGSKLSQTDITAWAKSLGTTPDAVQNAINTAKSANDAATQKAALDTANLTKAQNDATTGLNKTISTSNGSFSSTDGGKTWTPIQGSTKPTVPTATPGSTTASGLPAVTTAGGKGILVAGIKVDPTISNDVQAVLEGRNTLYNIRQTMGRTNAAAAYMQKMRDTLAQIDPKFDFIASDAGGKFVSSTFYQKAASAITSVMPNIDAVVALSDQVSRLGVTGVDALLQKGSVMIGNQQVSNFHTAQKLIADEIGLALGQGSVSDMKLQLGFDVTDTSVKPEVFASNMGVVKEFITNRLNALKDQRYSSSVSTGDTGGTPSALTPDVQSALKTNITIEGQNAYLPASVWAQFKAQGIQDQVIAEAKADGYTLLIK